MKSTAMDCEKNSSRGTLILREEINPWLKLVTAIFLMLLFFLGFDIISNYIPGASSMAKVIDDYNLRTTAIFYTDFETSSQSEEYIRSSLEYTPRQRLQKQR